MNRRDRRKPRASIGLESLGRREVPSTAGGMIARLKGALTSGLSHVDLQGSASGVPTTIVGDPDVGTTVDFKGAGNIAGFGPAKVGGSLNGTGFFASSRVEGTITLSAGKNSLTLQLRGSSEGGFQAPASGPYTFAVSKGTGAFRRDFGDGTVRLTLGPRSFTLTFQGKPDAS